jgi:hypothetical protein
MSQHHEHLSTQISAYLDGATCAQATGVLTVRQNLSIDDAAEYLERVARDLGVAKVELAQVIVASLTRGP